MITSCRVCFPKRMLHTPKMGYYETTREIHISVHDVYFTDMQKRFCILINVIKDSCISCIQKPKGCERLPVRFLLEVT